MNETHDSICPVELPTGNEVDIVRRRFQGEPGPHVVLVAGIRGDTPEGVRVLYDVTRIIRGLDQLTGTLDLYPCANPLAAHGASRFWPFFDVDLNRLFPGRADGHPPDRVAWALTEAVRPADVVVEVRGANPAFREMTQAHVRAGRERELDLALRTNVEVVWERNPGPSAPNTFVAQFETSITLEGGVGNRLTPGVGQDLAAGIVNLLAALGMVAERDVPIHWAAIQRPRRLVDAEVCRVRAEYGGVFLPGVALGATVQPGDPLGTVVDPMAAQDLEIIRAPVAGRILAVREQPLVYPGSMVARVMATEGGPA